MKSLSISTITWVLERDVFRHGDTIRAAALELGHRVVDWSDDWWSDSTARPRLTGPVVFHGSLGSADRIGRESSWKPGAYCQTAKFHCSAWYPSASEWLLHNRWEIHPASRFIAEADTILRRLETTEAVFVRPDSPLKPFSGRVLRREQINLAALDYGYYFEDVETPIVIAPVQQILSEWRYVVAERQVIAGSGYIAEGRAATSDAPQGRAWQFAAQIAEQIPAPDPVYVLDVCETTEGLRLLELNPFSGADLYACDALEIVRRVSQLAAKSNPRGDGLPKDQSR